jgi:hypothetical protein
MFSMQVEAANTAIDAHLEDLHERKNELRCNGLYGRLSTKLMGDGVTGRFDMGGMLGESQSVSSQLLVRVSQSV